MIKQDILFVLCFVHYFQNGRYLLPGPEPCLAHRATLPPVEMLPV